MKNSKEPVSHSDEAQHLRETLSALRTGFEGKPKELIPMLQMVQKELGYLPETSLEQIASLTGVPSAQVFGVATFYAQFRLQPVGRHVVKVCTGTACHVRGSSRIQSDIQKNLKIEPGETTEDHLFTLETVSCFGSCALAPVMVTDDSVHGRMNSNKADKLLEELADADRGDLPAKH